MSIDARIIAIKVKDNKLYLTLGQRDAKTPIGQRILIVLNFTVIPDIGDAVWGGADDVRIESYEPLTYRRNTVTTLVEKFSKQLKKRLGEDEEHE